MSYEVIQNYRQSPPKTYFPQRKSLVPLGGTETNDTRWGSS